MDHSEVKHLKVDHEPAKLDEVSKLMLKAAALIEKHGWCQNTAVGVDGGICVLQALGRANEYHGDEVLQSANCRLQSAVGAVPFLWNDAPERTKDEVIAKLRAVALGG